MDKYDVLYADPPWTYRDKCKSGNRGVEFKYPTMTIEDIKSLPVKEIASDNSALFLWVTWPLLKEGIDTLESWGLDYKTIAFNWIKMNKKSPTPFWGMGNWTRSNSEPCLLGVRGKPKRASASVHSVILSPIQKHSKKPDEARDRIVELMGDAKRIELFARELYPGWTCVGNDVDGSDIRQVLRGE